MKLTVVSLMLVLFPVSLLADGSRTIGWLEHVTIQPGQFRMTAKIDTGADHSSVHAEDIHIINNQQGQAIVSFTLENKQGDRTVMQKPLLRYSEIKSKVPGADPIRRPVVELILCIGETSQAAHVNLANRQNFRYRMLIGRSYLEKGFVVDPGRKFIVEPACL